MFLLTRYGPKLSTTQVNDMSRPIGIVMLLNFAKNSGPISSDSLLPKKELLKINI